MDLKPAPKNYIEGLCDPLTSMDVDRIDAFLNELSAAKREGRQVFIFENGGAASSASFMAADLNKGLSDGNKTRFRAICLNDSVPEMLAYAIDVSYNDVCVERLKNFFNPEDVVIGISGSGKSENVLRAIEYANIKDMQKTEDVFPMLGHMAYQMLADD